MARAAVIPGVSTDQPQQKATRGRGRSKSASVEAQDTIKAEPAKRGRKSAKTTTTATTASAKRGKSVETIINNDDGDDEEEEEDDDLSLDLIVTKKSSATTATTTKARTGRPPKQVAAKVVEEDDDDDELADFEVPKKKAGRPKTKASATTSKSQTTTVAGKSTRGRPKTVQVNEQEEQDEVDTATEKKTRGRRPAAKKTTEKNTIYVTTASTVSGAAKPRSVGDPAKKKKVTFADLSETEDVFSTAEQKPVKNVAKKSTISEESVGLKAKPVRKIGTATRGRPPKTQAPAAVKPLSPKKATQLAKVSSSSASSGEEDELAREKTIYKLVVQNSPVKSQEQQHTGLSSPVKRIALPSQSSTPARPAYGASHQDENVILSVQKLQLSSALRDSVFTGSPARRPPSSTSKETIKDTPRRGPLFTNHMSTSSNTEASKLIQSLSPLKASPKKGGNLGASFLSASPEKGSASLSTPFNAKLSLLKSPAKRIQSPFIFQKLDKKPVQTESETGHDGTDTEMQDDVFTSDQKSHDISHVIDDEPSDDELSMEVKLVNSINNDDVFVDYPSPEREQKDDDRVASDIGDDQDNLEIVEDYPELVGEMHSADENENIIDIDGLQSEAVDEEDVDMNDDELQINVSENIQFEQQSDDIHFDKENNDSGHISEFQCVNDTPHETEGQLEIPALATEIDEDAEQTGAINNAQDSTKGPLEEPTEVTTAESDHVVIYAEPDDENDDSFPEVETPRSSTMLISARSSIDPRDVIGADEVDELEDVSVERNHKFVPPAAPSPPISSSRAFGMSYRDNDNEYANSEYGSSPISRRQSTFSSRNSILPRPRSDSVEDTFTSLTSKLSSWKASSPEKTRKHTSERSIFSPVVSSKLANPRQSMRGSKYSQIQTMRHSLAARHSMANSVTMDSDELDTLAKQSRDDTLVKDDQQGEQQIEKHGKQTSPEKQTKQKLQVSMSITPVRINRDANRTVHTVSKVPLKPEGFESPIKCPRKRARSMSIDVELPIRASPARVKLVPKSRKGTTSDSPSPNNKRSPLTEVKTGDVQETEDHMIPQSIAASPAKTPRREPKADQHWLRGAVVFVDVHTTEGEDASGIFIELLTQMGAKCVKSWLWNPHASQSPNADGESGNNHNKVGITHVVYKDGGVRTMEKVRQAGDLVKCVGVGWVLDCERANKWVDESHYYVDSTIIPRGGAKRRKSMQPRALANVNGSLMSSTSSSSSLSSSIGYNTSTSSNRRSRLPIDWEETTEDFRRMSPSSSTNEIDSSSVPKTPTSFKAQPNNSKNSGDDQSEYNFDFNFDFSTMSPATPGFLSQNSRLVQQTCPPKQTNQGLFSSLLNSSSRNNNDRNGPDDVSSSGANLRFKLEAARRKSLAFKPRFGSPLSRS